MLPNTVEVAQNAFACAAQAGALGVFLSFRKKSENALPCFL
jgi:hypothetical protein